MGRMKHAALALTIACAAWCALPAAAQPVYACPRYDGSTSYQGTPCVGMPSGQQSIVGGTGAAAADASIQRLRKAGDEAQAIIFEAYQKEIRSLGLSPECEAAYLSSLSARVPEHCLRPPHPPLMR